jgi:hypothetical protein
MLSLIVREFTMKYLLSLFPLFYILTTTIANATDYYYCNCQAGASKQCVAGSDHKNGTTPTTSRRTISNANSRFRSMKGGDSIKFCRGGSFIADKNSRWINSKSSSAFPVTVTDYVPSGQNSDPRPIITKLSDSRLFNFDAKGHQEGYVFSNLDLRCTACKSRGNSSGFFFYRDIDHVVVDNVAIDGFRTGIQMAAVAKTGTAQDNYTFKKLSITNSKSIGFLGGANNLLIEDNYFEGNGTGTVFQHNLYVSRGNNIVIRGNELYRSSIDTNGQCNGTSFVVHAKGILDTVLIEGNTVREDIGKATPGCWGISVTTGYKTAEGFRNFTIRGNKIINVGNSGIGLTACQNCVIENNLILHEQAHKITAINVPDKARAANDLPMTNITVRNNSIYIASSGTGIKISLEGTQHSLVSNAIHYTGNRNFDCLNTDLPMSAYSEIDNNVCYFPNARSTSEWEKGSGTSPNPLAAWQATSGRGENSRMTNPGFTAPSLPQVNFALQTASGAIGAGHTTLSASKDFRGKTRNAQPDAGAFEFKADGNPARNIDSQK